MGTFKHFPEDTVCKICGTNNDDECVLIPIDGTEKINICQATPVHVKCIDYSISNLRFNPDLNAFYITGYDYYEKPTTKDPGTTGNRETSF